MTITNKTKSFVTIELDQNEVLDRQYFSGESGQGLLEISYFEGTGTLDFSQDEVIWIASAQSENTLFGNDLVYPRYIRSTDAGGAKIHFKICG